MLMLLFHLDNEQYALKSTQIIEVAPLVDLKKQPQAPNYVSGVFNYRGQIVPVIDLCQLIQGRSCHTHLSTRIILVNYQRHLGDEKIIRTFNRTEQHHSQTLTYSPLILGLMAERVVETLHRSETDLIDAKMQVEAAPYLGEMILTEQEMIQCIRIEGLLTEEQRSHLFATHDTASS